VRRWFLVDRDEDVRGCVMVRAVACGGGGGFGECIKNALYYK